MAFGRGGGDVMLFGVCCVLVVRVSVWSDVVVRLLAGGFRGSRRVVGLACQR